MHHLSMINMPPLHLHQFLHLQQRIYIPLHLATFLLFFEHQDLVLSLDLPYCQSESWEPSNQEFLQLALSNTPTPPKIYHPPRKIQQKLHQNPQRSSQPQIYIYLDQMYPTVKPAHLLPQLSLFHSYNQLQWYYLSAPQTPLPTLSAVYSFSQQNYLLSSRSLSFSPYYKQYTLNFIHMLRPKNKFYEPTKRQQQDEKLGDIYKMINLQQENMAQLLAKYQDKNETNQKESRSIETASLHSFSPNPNKNRSSSRIEHLTLELPVIGSNKKNPRKQSLKKSREKIINNNPYFFEVKDAKEKEKLKNHLDRAYKSERQKLKRSRSKGKIQQSERISAKSRDEMFDKLSQVERIKQERYIQSERQRLNSIKDANSQLPTPIGYFKDNIDPDSSSDEGQVPLTYYERQYRTMIRSQALQETNFLYFSKNESMKQWTEGLLLLFEKHDKQLQSLRKKCKYLQKFDDNFFTIDIFKQ